jgi:hypothetical protein
MGDCHEAAGLSSLRLKPPEMPQRCRERTALRLLMGGIARKDPDRRELARQAS